MSPSAIPSFDSYVPKEKKAASGIPDFESYVPSVDTRTKLPHGQYYAKPEEKASPGAMNSPGGLPDDLINFLRPIVAGSGAVVASGLSGPAAPIAGPATYIGLDALLQHLQKHKPQGLVSQATGMEPGGVASTLTNTAEQFGTGKLFDKVVNKGVNAVKAFRNVDQPEIMNLQPTSSQALRSEGYSTLANASKRFEDLNRTAKNLALDRTAGRGFSEALEVAKRNDLNFSHDPNEMLGVVNQNMPLGEGSLTKLKFKQNEASFTPINITEQPRQVTPITIQDRPVTPRTPISGQKDIIPGETKEIKAPSGKYDIAASHIASEKIPGSYTAQAGEQEFNQLADSFSKLDAVIGDPKKLQATLARGQELGTGENLKKSLGGYQFSKMFNSAMDSSTGSVRFDAAKLNAMMQEPEMQSSFGVLYNSNQRSNIQQFFKNVAATQDKLNTSSFGPNSSRFTLIGGGAILGHALYSGSLAGVAGIGVTTGLYLGAQQIGKLLANPKTARIMVSLAGREALGVSDQFASRVISDALNGATVALVNPDGSKTPGEIREGRFTPIGR